MLTAVSSSIPELATAVLAIPLHADFELGLSAIKGFQGAAGQTTFDNSGDVVRYPRLFVVREGQSVPYER